MPKLTSESFEGFPYGDLSFGRYDSDFQRLLLTSADVILEGKGSAPEPVRTQHHIELNFQTDIADPKQPDKNLGVHLILPVSADEYAVFKRPDNRLPEWEEDQTAAAYEEPREEKGLLSMFASDDEDHDEDFDLDDVEKTGGLSWSENHYGSQNLAYLIRAGVIQAIADTFLERVHLDEYLAAYNVPLPKDAPRPTATSLGIELYLTPDLSRHVSGREPKGKYDMLRGSTSSTGPINWGYHFSPFNGEGYRGDDGHGRPSKDDRAAELWREVVTEDIKRIAGFIGAVATTMRGSVKDFFDHTPQSYPVPPYSPAMKVHRRSEYFKGYQQYARAGMTLLHVSQWEYVSDYDFEGEVRLDVCEKKTDESKPNHVIFWADSEPEAYVRSTRLQHSGNATTAYFSSGFDGYYGETKYMRKDKMPDYTLRTLRASGMTDADIADLLAGKKWGEVDNPFSHTDYFKIVEFLGRISAK